MQDLAHERMSADAKLSPDRNFSGALIEWQKRHGRHDLPWQKTDDPYRIWISEIMLQQTQVATVLPYYARFLERFPNVHSLSAASLEEVLAMWSGLGYYPRARNLHKSAQIIVAHHAGLVPTDPAELQKLPGIGRSTAAAISVFATGRGGPLAAILDGNAIRVFCRVFGVEGYATDKKVRDRLWHLAELLLPENEIKAYTQGLMDLGAAICVRSRPKCHICPLAMNCVAHSEGREKELPAKGKTRVLPEKETTMLILVHRSRVLLQKRPLSGIWGGLLSLPEVAADSKALREVALRFGTIAQTQPLLAFTHTFTHLKLRVSPVLIILSKLKEHHFGEMDGEYLWYELADVQNAPLPSPVRKLLEETGFRLTRD